MAMNRKSMQQKVDETVNGNGHVADSQPLDPSELSSPDTFTAPWTGEEDADFEALQAPEAFRTPTIITPKDTKILVRRPRKQEFVRVRPDPEYRKPYAIIQDERNREALYVVHPSMYEHLEGEYRFQLLVTAISNVEWEVFLWPLPLAEADGRTYEWWESGMEMARLAETGWVKIKTNRNNYSAVPPYVPIEEPKWPEVPFGELFNRGFKGKVISTLDHPFVRRLRGGQ
jgi:hypothetical protein